MSLFLGTIYSTLELDTNGLAGQTRAAKRALGEVGDSADGMSKKGAGAFIDMVKASALGNIAAIGFSKSISMISNSVEGAVRRIDTLNNSARTFENMGFDADVSAKSIDALEKSIKGLPTPLDSAMRGMTSLAATYGDVALGQKVFTSLNNAILGFGGTAAMVDNAIQQLSQLPMDGPLDAQTWNSLRNSGLTPVLVAMAKESGMSVSKMKEAFGEGELKVKDFTDKLIQMNEKGGGGLKSLQQIATDSTKGIGTGIANMQTAVTRGMAAILEAVGSERITGALSNIGKGFESVMKYAAGGIGGAVSAMQDMGMTVYKHLEPSFGRLWLVITGQVIPAFMQIVNSPVVAFIGTALVGAIKFAIEATTWFLSVLAPFGGWLMNNVPLVTAIATAIIAYRVALMATTAIQAAHNAYNAITQAQYVMMGGTLVTMRGATLLQAAAQGVLNAVMAANPIALVIGALGALFGAFTMISNATNDAKNKQQSYNNEQLRGKSISDQLKLSQESLANAQLAATGSALAVERAEKTYEETKKRSGAGSLEAREAEHQLKLAKEEQTRTNEALKKSQEDETKVKQNATQEEIKRRAEVNKTTSSINAQMFELDGLNGKLNNLNGKTFTYTVEMRQKDMGIIQNGVSSQQAKNEAATRLQGRYLGGSVKRNQPYFVGENRDGTLNRTSELFVPGQSGRIINSQQLQSMLRGASTAPSGAPTGPSLTATAFSGDDGGDDGQVFKGNTFHITMEGVNDPDEFAKELKLAFSGR